MNEPDLTHLNAETADRVRAIEESPLPPARLERMKQQEARREGSWWMRQAMKGKE